MEEAWLKLFVQEGRKEHGMYEPNKEKHGI